MVSGADTLNELRTELNAIVSSADPAGMNPHVEQVARLLEGVQPELSVDLPGISVDVTEQYNELVGVFKKGSAALGGANPDAAMSELKALAGQALDQIGKAL